MRRRNTRKRVKKQNVYSRKVGGAHGKMFRFFNWWGVPTLQEKQFFQSMLESSSEPYHEVHIHATMSTPTNRAAGVPLPKNSMGDNILRVQYAGEGSYGHVNKFHINIVPGDHPPSPQFVTNPFMHLHMMRNQYPMEAFTIKRGYTGPREKFCIFSVSNPAPNERIQCFNELSQYKRVDSCGKVLNNMGFNCPGAMGNTDHINFLSKYKFSICFENTSMKNYLTEKLAIAWLAGTIPIYWGCPNIADYVNMDSIVYLKPDFMQEDLHKLIEEVKVLDQDEALYRKKYEHSLFKDGAVPAAFDLKALNEKIRSALARGT